MSQTEHYDIFVGGKSGVFKGVKVGQKTDVIKNIQDLVSITESDQVTTLCWGDDEERDILIACGVKGDKRVKIYNSQTCSFTCSFICNRGKGGINGISRYDGSILTAVESGEISLWPFNEQEKVLINAGENLNKMCHSSVQKNIIATGGFEHRLKLFDLEKQTMIFTEKNVSHDWLELRVPIWISDINFLPKTQQIATASRYGHVRLYDPRAQRRPVINMTFQDEALTCLTATSMEKQIIVGSGKGKLNLIDLRRSGTVLNTYKGFAGGVTDVACSMSKPYVASVSLDRYLRIHHLETKELVKKIYLTSQLTCLITRSDFSIERELENNKEVKKLRNNDQSLENGMTSETEYDELFNQMQVIDSKNKKSSKKRKYISAPEDSSNNHHNRILKNKKNKEKIKDDSSRN